MTNTTRPLSALLSQLLVAYMIELDNKFELRMARAGIRGARLSLILWTNVLRFFPTEGEISFRDLATRSYNPRERLKLYLGCLERWRVVEFEQAGQGKREGWGSGRGVALDSIVRLTSIGKQAVKIWPPLWEEIENRWKERFGSEDYHALQTSMVNIARRFEVEFPLGLPGSLEVAEGESYPPRKDWGQTNLSVSALLSQLLLEFATEFNRKSRTPLVLCANVIRVLSGDNHVRAADLPILTGGSPEAADIGWRLKPYVILENDPSGKRGKVIRLSSVGVRAQRGYYQFTEEIERDWETRFGTSEVRALRASLEKLIDKEKDGKSILGLGLVPPPGIARAGTLVPALGCRDLGTAARQRGRDLVNQTQRFLENPKEALPHYPMWDANRGFGP